MPRILERRENPMELITVYQLENGTRVYAFNIKRWSNYFIKVKTVCEMKFANDTRQAKSLRCAVLAMHEKMKDSPCKTASLE
jgi:hypothetical protein